MSDPETPAEIFKRLLSELRRLWNDLQGSRLFFEIFCPSYYDSSDPDPRVKELATLCYVNLPLTSAVSDFTVSSGWVFVREIPRDDARIDRLRKLFREAGAHVPSDYLTRLRGYMHLIAEPASRWVALICFAQRIHALQCQRQNPEEHAGKEWKVWWISEHVVTEPVQSSIELIEQLRLNTENPVPLHELEIEQPWPPDVDARNRKAAESDGERSQTSAPALTGESHDADSGLPSDNAKPRRKKSARNSPRKLTPKQKHILECHKQGQGHEATARLAQVYDQYGEPDIALVKKTLKANSEYIARQEKRR